MGAGALIFDDQRRVLLGLRGDNRLWGIPAGQMELGETPAGTAMRETCEEIGLQIRVTKLMGVYTGADALHTYPDGNQVQVAGARFLAEVVGGDLKPDGYETLDVQWFDVERSAADGAASSLRDGRSVEISRGWKIHVTCPSPEVNASQWCETSLHSPCLRCSSGAWACDGA